VGQQCWPGDRTRCQRDQVKPSALVGPTIREAALHCGLSHCSDETPCNMISRYCIPTFGSHAPAEESRRGCRAEQSASAFGNRHRRRRRAWRTGAGALQASSQPVTNPSFADGSDSHTSLGPHILDARRFGRSHLVVAFDRCSSAGSNARGFPCS
jgi:hypothetical protein